MTISEPDAGQAMPTGARQPRGDGVGQDLAAKPPDPVEPGADDILPPASPAQTPADLARVARLLRGEDVPADILRLLVSPVGRAVAEAADYAANALADATLSAYAADWRHFCDWCRVAGSPPCRPTG